MKKIAIVHDYLFQYGGAEKVVEKWLEMYPEADLFTSFFVPEMFIQSAVFKKAALEGRIKTTWMNHLFRFKFMLKFQKHLFWLYPLVTSMWTIRDFDVVLISSTYCAKNIKIHNCKKIIHYCHSPTRYLHGMVRETDLKTINPILRKLIPFFTFGLKQLDLSAVKYLNKKGCVWVANSNFIQKLIQEIYKTDSQVVYPPIELNRFSSIILKVDTINPYYFYFGRISFHKKIEVIVEACLSSNKRVVIAGLSGFKPEMDKLRNMVQVAETLDYTKQGLVSFVEKRITDEEVCEYLSSCRAFLFPAKEDSGMVPVEVLSSGTPVIAYGAGGALEYIQNKKNGILFTPQNAAGLIEAINQFESMGKLDVDYIKLSSQPFSEETFKSKMRLLID